MRLQNATVSRVKQHTAKGGLAPRRVLFGPAAGARLLLDRRVDLQRELGIYETETRHVYKRFISADAVVHDIGASDGYSTLLFAILAPLGAVISFEPEAVATARFKTNLALNPDLAPRVSLQPILLGDGVNGVRLDDLLNAGSILPPDFIKVDVEGAENDVLVGMETTLSQHRPVMLVEVHGMQAESECAGRLRALAYDVRIVPNAWWRFFYPEWRPIVHNRWLLAIPDSRSTQPIRNQTRGDTA